MTRYKKFLPRKVEYARDALVTLIHDRSLQSGDRLPTYAALRNELGLGSQTIAGAVGLLCDAGVLEVRDKVGIFVKNPAGGLLAGRTIAVAVRQLEGSAYAASLAAFIQRFLNEQNCRCLTFYRRAEKGGERPDIEEFPGLGQTIAEHRCDGVLTLCPFSDDSLNRITRLGLPCCFIGDDDQHFIHFGVVIEVSRFLNEAAELLRQQGAGRIVQLAISPRQLALRSGCGLPGLVGLSYAGGAAIAGKLLAMPGSQRPDGLISDDDTVVSGLLAELIRRQFPKITYMPRIATIVHKELGEYYPSDRMILFEQSISDYASLAVNLLLEQLRGEEVEKKRIVYRFTPVGI
ncbi:MAG: GntR family transcriptional regulator [Lentisphaeria bacterium]|nr:GntR family transcriptional regulator [Lentisphaeria bacterium]